MKKSILVGAVLGAVATAVAINAGKSSMKQLVKMGKNAVESKFDSMMNN